MCATVIETKGTTETERYVLRLHDPYDGGAGLGVAVGLHIFTSGHQLPANVFASRDIFIELEAVSSDGEKVEPLLQTCDICMDFAVLGIEPIWCGHEDNEPRVFEELTPWLVPSDIVIETDEPVFFPGYYFLPDGLTRIDSKISTSKHSTDLIIHDSQVAPGCSGGPIFAKDGDHLIGILQMSAKVGGKTEHGVGVRIDMAISGYIRHEIGPFRNFKPEVG